jgi:hypothetical protein
MAAFLLSFGSGCVGLDSFIAPKDAPPTGKACQVVATWNKEVLFAPDPANGGIAKPGVTGRLYLFGPQIDYPLAANGSLIVDLFTIDPPVADTTGSNAALPPPAANGTAQPRLLEEWRIDKDTLQKLLHKDTIGWGYTLFLPWGSYHPDITQVRLKIRYDPAEGGLPLYTESGPLTLAKQKRN